jgi:hypothetical protein
MEASLVTFVVSKTSSSRRSRRGSEVVEAEREDHTEENLNNLLLVFLEWGFGG